MLYLTIPLGVALVALVGVGILVWRKMPYLRKLEPDAHETGETLLHDFAPEVVDWWQGIPWRQYLHRSATLTEQVLSWLRVFVQSIDRHSSTAIRRVRFAGRRAARSHKEVVAQLEQDRQERQWSTEPDPDAVADADPERLKQEEQRLIVAIAQNPKDSSLYADLARISIWLGNLHDARESMEQALKLDPANEEYQNRLERIRRKEHAALPPQG